jgi:hypothetical protein
MNKSQHQIDQNLLQKNLNGEYQFNLKVLLEDGLKRTFKHFFPFLQMMAILIAIVFVVFFLFLNIAGIQSEQDLTQSNILAFQLVVQIIMAPLVAGLMLQGVKANLKNKLLVSDLFALLPQSLPIVVISVFVSLLTGLGMGLYVLPGIYVYIATSFAILLTADKKLTPLQALLLSVKMINRYLPKFLLLYLVFGGLLLLCLFTYGLGFVLVAPFYQVVKGALYRDLFGYANNTPTPQNEKDQSTFEA